MSGLIKYKDEINVFNNKDDFQIDFKKRMKDDGYNEIYLAVKKSNNFLYDVWLK